MSALHDALFAALAAVAPVCNLDAADESDRTTWRCGFLDTATDDQRAAAANVLATFTLPDPVPSSVTNYQARRALRAAALFDKADAAVRGAGNPVFVDAWDYANVFLREDDVITAMGAALGLTSSQVDDLFRAAAKFA
jgi:hypothetical protein